MRYYTVGEQKAKIRLERENRPLLDVFGADALHSRVKGMEEARKHVLGIIARILVARHLRTADGEDLRDGRPSPRTESLVASAMQWAERIMRRIDSTFADLADDKRWPRV
jgi:hypothetical protein